MPGIPDRFTKPYSAPSRPGYKSSPTDHRVEASVRPRPRPSSPRCLFGLSLGEAGDDATLEEEFPSVRVDKLFLSLPSASVVQRCRVDGAEHAEGGERGHNFGTKFVTIRSRRVARRLLFSTPKAKNDGGHWGRKFGLKLETVRPFLVYSFLLPAAFATVTVTNTARGTSGTVISLNACLPYIESAAYILKYVNGSK